MQYMNGPLEGPKPPHSRRLASPLHCIDLSEGSPASARGETAWGGVHTRLWSNNINKLMELQYAVILSPVGPRIASYRRGASYTTIRGEGGGQVRQTTRRGTRSPATDRPTEGCTAADTVKGVCHTVGRLTPGKYGIGGSAMTPSVDEMRRRRHISAMAFIGGPFPSAETPLFVAG